MEAMGDGPVRERMRDRIERLGDMSTADGLTPYDPRQFFAQCQSWPQRHRYQPTGAVAGQKTYDW